MTDNAVEARVIFSDGAEPQVFRGYSEWRIVGPIAQFVWDDEVVSIPINRVRSIREVAVSEVEGGRVSADQLSPAGLPKPMESLFERALVAQRRSLVYRLWWFGVLAWRMVRVGATRPRSAMLDFAHNVKGQGIRWTADGDTL